jgi:hypothetical protein
MFCHQRAAFLVARKSRLLPEVRSHMGAELGPFAVLVVTAGIAVAAAAAALKTPAKAQVRVRAGKRPDRRSQRG